MPLPGLQGQQLNYQIVYKQMRQQLELHICLETPEVLPILAESLLIPSLFTTPLMCVVGVKSVMRLSKESNPALRGVNSKPTRRTGIMRWGEDHSKRVASL